MTRLLQWGRAIAERTQGRYADRGAGFVEYAGLLLLIAAVVVGVMGLGIPGLVTDAVRDAVGRIL
ncbi:hypothetical protein [Streptomyces hainanensis]|uniref:Flp family type IVb pilin n=1 Tax=Streptomyces hainanensis TaxID=402648 RepID=A0A4R4TM11_9ACTN|nr:hypothetical protein [Streptomyces hainanensis]TDC75109.1 hypothetical protein E1283_13495 [Streptomyces hainanensis]